jgi:hypothetical protein
MSDANNSALSFIALVLGSGVVSSALNLAVNGYVSHRRDRREAGKARAYSALRIAVNLEEFASKCGEILDASNTRGEPYGGPDQLPPIPAFSPDIDWRELDVGLASRALSLDALVRVVNNGLSNSRFVFGAETAEAECTDFCAELGWDAWHLAQTLRVAHGVELPAERLPWNFPSFLRKQATSVRQRKAKFKRDIEAN